MKLQLPNVTLISVSSIKIPETIASLERSMNLVDFGAVKLVSHKKPILLHENILFEQCPELKCIDDYNDYVFRNLIDHVQTDFALVTQYDSWVIYPNAWINEFLQYDYIGAIWPERFDAYWANNEEHVRVGNGGFSLRSKLLLETPRKNNWQLRREQGYASEDGNIACYYRKELLEAGIKYAPVTLAARFSFENPVPENYGILPFGFHRNMPRFWMDDKSQ